MEMDEQKERKNPIDLVRFIQEQQEKKSLLPSGTKVAIVYSGKNTIDRHDLCRLLSYRSISFPEFVTTMSAVKKNSGLPMVIHVFETESATSDQLKGVMSVLVSRQIYFPNLFVIFELSLGSHVSLSNDHTSSNWRSWTNDKLNVDAFRCIPVLQNHTLHMFLRLAQCFVGVSDMRRTCNAISLSRRPEIGDLDHKLATFASYQKNPQANLFVRPLKTGVTTQHVRTLFQRFGTILSCHIPVDGYGLTKHYGFVRFAKQNDALCAIQELHGNSTGWTRCLTVVLAKDTPTNNGRLKKSLILQRQFELTRTKVVRARSVSPVSKRVVVKQKGSKDIL
jgi:hypothetical protein